MSQYSDILKHMIVKGIRANHDSITIVADIGDMLSVLDYDEPYDETYRGVYNTATWMRTQKENLYGVSDKQFLVFLSDLWAHRQDLPPPK